MNLLRLQQKLSPEQEATLLSLQLKLQEEMLATREVTYLGKQFYAAPTVFPPRPDSVGLVQAMDIHPVDSVCDVCTGSGVIGIFALIKGASNVVGLDINPATIITARYNAQRHNVADRFSVIVSDVLDVLHPKEKFDVFTFNPPFRNRPAKSFIEKTMWDEGYTVHRKFFETVGNHLKKNGRIYMAQASWGDFEELEKLLVKHDFSAKLLTEKPFDPLPGAKFYALEIMLRQDVRSKTS